MYNYANAIKESINMRDAAEYYGYTVNGAGFMRCPFHDGDHTPSMKIYKGNKGYNCFGCGANGDVISFVMELNNITFLEACKKLNDDFTLGFDFSPVTDYRERKKRNAAVKEYIQQQRAKHAEHDRLKDEYERALDRWAKNDYIIINSPLCSDEWHSALNDIGYSKYLLEEAETALYEFESKERERDNRAVNP